MSPKNRYKQSIKLFNIDITKQHIKRNIEFRKSYAKSAQIAITSAVRSFNEYFEKDPIPSILQIRCFLALCNYKKCIRYIPNQVVRRVFIEGIRIMYLNIQYIQSKYKYFKSQKHFKLNLTKLMDQIYQLIKKISYNDEKVLYVFDLIHKFAYLYPPHFNILLLCRLLKTKNWEKHHQQPKIQFLLQLTKIVSIIEDPLQQAKTIELVIDYIPDPTVTINFIMIISAEFYQGFQSLFELKLIPLYYNILINMLEGYEDHDKVIHVITVIKQNPIMEQTVNLLQFQYSNTPANIKKYQQILFIILRFISSLMIRIQTAQQIDAEYKLVSPLLSLLLYSPISNTLKHQIFQFLIFLLESRLIILYNFPALLSFFKLYPAVFQHDPIMKQYSQIIFLTVLQNTYYQEIKTYLNQFPTRIRECMIGNISYDVIIKGLECIDGMLSEETRVKKKFEEGSVSWILSVEMGVEGILVEIGERVRTELGKNNVMRQDIEDKVEQLLIMFNEVKNRMVLEYNYDESEMQQEEQQQVEMHVKHMVLMYKFQEESSEQENENQNDKEEEEDEEKKEKEEQCSSEEDSQQK